MHLSTTLSGGESRTIANRGLLDDLVALGKDHLDVAGARHVGVDLQKQHMISSGSNHGAKHWQKWVSTYTTVGTVSASPLVGSLVDLDVLDDKVASVKTLGVGIGLSVLEEREEELGGLRGPAGFADTELLAY